MGFDRSHDFGNAVYERAFVVAAPITRAWLAFTDPQERDAWMANPYVERFEPAEIAIGAVEPLRRLRWSQRYGGLDGTYETTVTFESVDDGTRIRIVRRGFGESDAWRHYAHNTARGWDEMIADLALYLETAVRGARHFSFRSGLGATMLQSAAGVRITSVIPGGFAARAGMQAGDVLLRLNGASVVHLADVAFIGREREPGEIVEAEYVRGATVLRNSAPLSEWHYGSESDIGHPGAYPKVAFSMRSDMRLETRNADG